MVKRPIGIYFVAAWTLCACLSLVFPFAWVFFPVEILPRLNHFSFNATYIFNLIFVAFLLIGLIQLKPVQRWASVAMLGLWSVMLIFTSTQLPPQKELGILALLLALILSTNCIAIWYLSRPSFHRLCVQYRASKQPPT